MRIEIKKRRPLRDGAAYKLFVEELFENLMEAGGSKTGEQTTENDGRGDAVSPMRPNGDSQANESDDKGNVSVVKRSTVLNQQTNDNTDADDDVIEVGGKPRYISRADRLLRGGGDGCFRERNAGENDDDGHEQGDKDTKELLHDGSFLSSKKIVVYLAVMIKFQNVGIFSIENAIFTTVFFKQAVILGVQ